MTSQRQNPCHPITRSGGCPTASSPRIPRAGSIPSPRHKLSISYRICRVLTSVSRCLIRSIKSKPPRVNRSSLRSEGRSGTSRRFALSIQSNTCDHLEEADMETFADPKLIKFQRLLAFIRPFDVETSRRLTLYSPDPFPSTIVNCV